MTERLLPELWPLNRVAKELGKHTHVLVDAARRGEFCPVHKVGAVWYVRAEAVRDWFARNHAEPATPAQIAAMRQAARGAGS